MGHNIATCLILALTGISFLSNGQATLRLSLSPSEVKPNTIDVEASSEDERNKRETLHSQPEDKRFKRGYYYDHPHRYEEASTSGHPSWSGRMLNKFRHRTSNLINSASQIAYAHENNQDDYDNEEDNAMAGAFWNLYGSGGGGHGGGYGKHVNKSAVGLLGFLSLLSLIQRGLTTTMAPMAMPAPAPAPAPGRRKRDTDIPSDNVAESTINQADRIAQIVAPLLTIVSTTGRVGSTDDECMLHHVCYANKVLVNEFYEHGRSVGVMLSDALGKMLKDKGKGESVMKLRYAGTAGRNGKDCRKLYTKICPSLPH